MRIFYKPIFWLLMVTASFVSLTLPNIGSADGNSNVQDPPFTPQASSGSTALFTIAGSTSGTANGDYISDSGGLNTFYRYFIEVPPGLSRLAIDIFDADVGLGGGTEDTAGRDRDRNDGFDTSVTYTLIDPTGAARTTQFTTGDDTAPAGSDNAWITLFNGTGNNVRDNFGTAAFTNNDGNNNWSAAWIEADGGGAGATTGAIQITGGELRLQDDVGGTPSLAREADLLGTPGLNLSAAFLSFDFRTSNNLEDGDEINIQVSNNGGSTYTTLETFSNDSSGSRTYDITSFIANNTRIRFQLAGGYTGTEFFFVDNLQIHDGGPVTAGHWELRIDMSTGNDINAFGVRAHDGTSGSGGTELNTYMESFAALGVNPPASGTISRSYTLYPYITSGCTCSKNDFDYDSNSGVTGSLSLSSRTGSFTQNYMSSSMSGNNVWRRDSFSGWTTDALSVDYGIWQSSAVITSYLVGGTPNGNYTDIYFGNFLAAANPPTANPQPNTFRIYLPTDAGAAPVKPYLEQLLTHSSGNNPPVIGVPSRFQVTVRLVNPTPQAITFSASNLVTANVPGGGAVYAGNAAVSQGSIVSQPSVGGTGNITWNPGTVAAGATVLLTYRVDLTFTSAGQRLTVTSTPASGNGTRAQFVDETGNTTQARATYLLGPLCELALTQGVTPTAIELASFRATAYDGGVLVRWETGFEVDNLGFKLYRDEGGKRVPITEQMIAGSALVAGSGVALGAGRSYEWWDEEGGSASYWLEEIDTAGQSVWHGPYMTKRAGGPAPKNSRATLLKDAGRAPSTASAGERLERAARLAAVSPQPSPIQLSLAQQPAIKLYVRREGWYRVTQPELIAAGLNPNVNPRFLQMFVDGQQLPINIMSKGGQFDSSAAVEFYGMGLDTALTDARVYWLVAGSEPGLRIRQESAGGPPSTARNFLYTVERKDRTLFFFSLKNGEKENFFGATVSPAPVDQMLTLQNIDTSTTALATLEVALQGATLAPHLVRVQLNGTDVGTLSFDGQTEGLARLKLSQRLLKEGANLVTLVAEGGQNDFSFVDYIRISYWHTFTADGDALQLTTPGKQQVTIGGFTSSAIRVLDVTDPGLVQELNGQVIPVKGGFAVKVTPSATGQRTLLALTDARAKSPAALSLNRPSSLASIAGGSDLVIIAHRDFAEGVEPLKALRESQGLFVASVDIEDVYDEFSFGQKSPQAVRDFLALAREMWTRKPRFVMLVGNASRDPKNYTGFGDLDFLPSKIIDTSSMETASDDWYIDFGDDEATSMSIGRLPARDAEQLSAMVSKIIGYEQDTPSSEALLYADSNAGFDFESATAALAPLLPAGVTPEQINRGQIDAATARARLLQAIQRGQKLVNYAGHGSATIWKDFVLTADDADSLNNDGRLPLFLMMTCLNGYFLDPGAFSLAESLMKAKTGGAIAVWASSGMTAPGEQMLMNQELYGFIFPGGGQPVTLGEAMARAKAAINDRDVRRTWILFGDPTTRLR
jgi:hypothetical protein